MNKGTSVILTLPPALAGTRWPQALRAAVVLLALCGGLYPLLAVALGALLFHHQATGSLIERGGQAVGSALVGQPFTAPGYFHGRPSAAGYDPFNVAGSNAAASNSDLRARAQVEPPLLGLFGQARVNVLRLNLALDTRL